MRCTGNSLLTDMIIPCTTKGFRQNFRVSETLVYYKNLFHVQDHYQEDGSYNACTPVCIVDPSANPCDEAGCAGRCTVEDGSAVCTCSDGYQLADDGKTCDGQCPYYIMMYVQPSC